LHLLGSLRRRCRTSRAPAQAQAAGMVVQVAWQGSAWQQQSRAWPPSLPGLFNRASNKHSMHHACDSWRIISRTAGWQQKPSVHVPLGQAVDCLLVSAVKPAPQVYPEHCNRERRSNTPNLCLACSIGPATTNQCTLPHICDRWRIIRRTAGWQQKPSVHVPLGQTVDCLLVSAVKPAPQV
jgi:hypothetical protein